MPTFDVSQTIRGGYADCQDVLLAFRESRLQRMAGCNASICLLCWRACTRETPSISAVCARLSWLRQCVMFQHTAFVGVRFWLPSRG